VIVPHRTDYPKFWTQLASYAIWQAALPIRNLSNYSAHIQAPWCFFFALTGLYYLAEPVNFKTRSVQARPDRRAFARHWNVILSP